MEKFIIGAGVSVCFVAGICSVLLAASVTNKRYFMMSISCASIANLAIFLAIFFVPWIKHVTAFTAADNYRAISYMYDAPSIQSSSLNQLESACQTG